MVCNQQAGAGDRGSGEQCHDLRRLVAGRIQQVDELGHAKEDERPNRDREPWFTEHDDAQHDGHQHDSRQNPRAQHSIGLRYEPKRRWRFANSARAESRSAIAKSGHSVEVKTSSA